MPLKIVKVYSKRNGTHYFYGLHHWSGRGSHFSAYARLAKDNMVVKNNRKAK